MLAGRMKARAPRLVICASSRPSVTPKKKRKTETAAFMEVAEEALHAFTSSCSIPSPRSSEASAALIPAICHSCTALNPLIAPAARNGSCLSQKNPSEPTP